MSTVIGFSGKLGSGKDTAADRLISHFIPVDLKVVRGSFARKLKSSAASCWGERFDMAMWEEWKNDPNVKVMIVRVNAVPLRETGDYEDLGGEILAEETVREFLQHYGTKAHRGEFGSDFWVEQGFNNLPPYDVLVFTDVRFDNEAEMIRSRGGVVVRVEGDNDETGTHESEAGISANLVDWTLRNDVRDDGFEHLDRELSILINRFLPLRLAV